MASDSNMYKPFEEVDYSEFNLEKAMDSLTSSQAKLDAGLRRIQPPISQEDLMYNLRRRKASTISTNQLVDIVQAANSEKRNTFSEYFIMNDFKDQDSILEFEGGQIGADDNYPGCLQMFHPSSCKARHEEDIRKLVYVADRCCMMIHLDGSFHCLKNLLTDLKFEVRQEERDDEGGKEQNERPHYWYDGVDYDAIAASSSLKSDKPVV